MYFRIALLLISHVLLANCGQNGQKTHDFDKQISWQEMEKDAAGESLSMMMWQGDPLINSYMQDYVKPEVKKRFNINLQIINGQGNKIVRALMGELEAGAESSQVDICWINGETFYQLRQIDALFGPFVKQLPNSQYINWESPFIAQDFQQPIDGYECPWGNVQMTWIYNSSKVQQLPQNLAELKKWMKNHPGRFTFSYDFTGMTLLKSWLMELAGGPTALQGEFNESLYQKSSSKLWKYIKELKPYLWNEGKSFPESVAKLHQLFASGEIYFTMSNNDVEVDNKVRQGVFPSTARAYVPQIGSIQNSHYLGIPKLSVHKEAALVFCNFLISPEAQLQKYKPAVWGDGTILDIDSLPETWQDSFATFGKRTYAPDREEIQAKALQEPAPEYMIRLFEDFRKEIIL